MGIHGIYKEIGLGRRVALSKYSVEHYVQHGRPLRLAIDISIWLFQIQASKGGSNPALRTFYYRLLRLLSLNIHPLFVFDGPNKPEFKRNKRVGGPGVKVSSVPEFLAKQLLKQFGFPQHLAPGEAEAECALLQREGIVDAVLSEDVDTLMFGSGITMRSWKPDKNSSSKVPTHINIHDAQITKEDSGLDREGMILIALMSGGDYIPEGIPGCGPKTACEAARAGFGAELCKLKKRDSDGFKEWRDRLRHELWTNESKLFRTKRRIEIPEDFPNRGVLGYYTNPCVSGPEKLATLRTTLKWDMPIDFPSLRSFTADAFDWTCLGGAKKFIRNLAPAILTRELRMRAEQGANDGEDLDVQESAEAQLVVAIHGKRTHVSTDNMTEIRISFLPMNIVSIDLSQEPPDEDIASTAEVDSDEEALINDDVEIESIAPSSPRKRGPSKYNPEELEKIWLMDAFVRQGIPLKMQDWEASFRDPKQYLAQKRATKEATKKKKSGGMRQGALDPFTRISKPGAPRPLTKSLMQPMLDSVDLLMIPSSAPPRVSEPSQYVAPPKSTGFRKPAVFDAARGGLDEVDLSELNQPRPTRPRKRPSPEPGSSARRIRSQSDTPKASPRRQQTIIDLISSPSTPTKAKNSRLQAVEHSPAGLGPPKDQSTAFLDDFTPLPDTVTKRRKRSPFKRYETAPAGLGSTPLLDKWASPGLDPALASDSDDELPELNMARPAPAASRLTSKSEARDMTRQGHSAMVSDKAGTLSAESAVRSNVNALDMTGRSGALISSSGNIMQRFTLAAEAAKPKPVVKKKHYQIRESLEGAWTEVEVEVELDLTSPSASGVMGSFVPRKPASKSTGIVKDKEKEKTRTRWRQSEVEILDLT